MEEKVTREYSQPIVCDMFSWHYSDIHCELAAKEPEQKGFGKLQGVDSGERKKKKPQITTDFFTFFKCSLEYWLKQGENNYNHWDMNNKNSP